MQVLKPEIRKKIIEASEAQFFQNGFERTLTRTIADMAGISVSNLYKYYENKEALFAAVVDSHYQKTVAALAELFEGAHSADDSDMMDAIMRPMIEMMTRERRAFIILMGRSQGTRYAGFRDEVAGKLAAHLQESVRPDRLNNPFILGVLASNFFEALLKIAENDGSEAFAQDNIGALVRYHMAGMAEFMRDQ